MKHLILLGLGLSLFSACAPQMDHSESPAARSPEKHQKIETSGPAGNVLISIGTEDNHEPQMPNQILVQFFRGRLSNQQTASADQNRLNVLPRSLEVASIPRTKKTESLRFGCDQENQITTLPDHIEGDTVELCGSLVTHTSHLSITANHLILSSVQIQIVTSASAPESTLSETLLSVTQLTIRGRSLLQMHEPEVTPLYHLPMALVAELGTVDGSGTLQISSYGGRAEEEIF